MGKPCVPRQGSTASPPAAGSPKGTPPGAQLPPTHDPLVAVGPTALAQMHPMASFADKGLAKSRADQERPAVLRLRSRGCWLKHSARGRTAPFPMQGAELWHSTPAPELGSGTADSLSTPWGHLPLPPALKCTVCALPFPLKSTVKRGEGALSGALLYTLLRTTIPPECLPKAALIWGQIGGLAIQA